jgi:hypothetical protein
MESWGVPAFRRRLWPGRPGRTYSAPALPIPLYWRGTTPVLSGAAAQPLDLVTQLSRLGETWRILFADIGEAVTYCPECAEREF